MHLNLPVRELDSKRSFLDLGFGKCGKEMT